MTEAIQADNLIFIFVYVQSASASPGGGRLKTLIEATAMPLLPVKPRIGPLVARTAFHDSHSFSGNVMGLMTALRQMLSASDTVSLPGSLQESSRHLMLLSLKRCQQLAAWNTLYSYHE